MPRRNSAVKKKSTKPPTSRRLLTTPGVVDLHFHGAFGMDLMTASEADLNRLAAELWKSGVAAFCPTTLSSPKGPLLEAVARIGAWVERCWKTFPQKTAMPLGIHLEGPFIHPSSRGAHPEDAIRKVTLAELESLWEASRKTLKILTIAPETLEDLPAITSWCLRHEVVLSLGHSKATEEIAADAFDHGFTGVTHAWNALPFHHRAPGPLGAALGREGVHIELIIDQVHVAPTVMEWTRKLHGREPLCYVSDCVPAAQTAAGEQAGPWTAFGPLKIREESGACRLPDGTLAGGGSVLSQMIARLVELDASRQNQPIVRTLKTHLRHWSSDPLRALPLAKQLKSHILKGRVEWSLDRNRLIVRRFR